MRNRIQLKSDDACLEGVLQTNSKTKAVVVTHPHPLYGGNMDNPVVSCVADAFFAKGYTALCFNFRGTGNSTGSFDEGRGEQKDVGAAISFLRDSGYEHVVLAGYSFGSKINASVVSAGCDIQDHIMISPPVAFMSFDDIVQLPGTGLVVTGEDDEIAPPDQIRSFLDRLEMAPVFDVISSCDHFYSGCLNRLGDILSRYLV